jgi:hypothetical protein
VRECVEVKNTRELFKSVFEGNVMGNLEGQRQLDEKKNESIC